jgi:hypothetical protein
MLRLGVGNTPPPVPEEETLGLGEGDGEDDGDGEGEGEGEAEGDGEGLGDGVVGVVDGVTEADGRDGGAEGRVLPPESVVASTMNRMPRTVRAATATIQPASLRRRPLPDGVGAPGPDFRGAGAGGRTSVPVDVRCSVRRDDTTSVGLAPVTRASVAAPLWSWASPRRRAAKAAAEAGLADGSLAMA